MITREIQRLKLRIKKSGDEIIALSMGIANGKAVLNSNFNGFIERADVALYRVKKNGKNKIESMLAISSQDTANKSYSQGNFFCVRKRPC